MKKTPALRAQGEGDEPRKTTAPHPLSRLARTTQHALGSHELRAVDKWLRGVKVRRSVDRKPISLAPSAFLTRPDTDDRWRDWPADRDDGGGT
jgi:hypothetical protein